MNDKYENALKAINDVFGDMSVSKAATIENLQSLKDEIDVMIDTLKD